MEKTFAALDRKSEYLSSTRWAIDLEWKEVEGIAEYMDLYRAGRGEVIFSEGEKGDYMCAVVSGEVEVRKADASERLKKIASIGAGGFLGEMSLVDGSPRSATAVAGRDSTLLVLTSDDFDRLAEAKPLLAVKLVKKVARTVSQRLRQTSGVLVDYIGSD